MAWYDDFRARYAQQAAKAAAAPAANPGNWMQKPGWASMGGDDPAPQLGPLLRDEPPAAGGGLLGRVEAARAEKAGRRIRELQKLIAEQEADDLGLDDMVERTNYLRETGKLEYIPRDYLKQVDPAIIRSPGR